jgi:hypothetical protein
MVSAATPCLLGTCTCILFARAAQAVLVHGRPLHGAKVPEASPQYRKGTWAGLTWLSSGIAAAGVLM